MLPGFTHAQRAGQEETALEGAEGDARADRENIHDLDNLPPSRSPTTFEDGPERDMLGRRSSTSADGGTSTTRPPPFEVGVSPIPNSPPSRTERPSRVGARTIGTELPSVPGVRRVASVTTPSLSHSRARLGEGEGYFGVPAKGATTGPDAAALGNARTPYLGTINNALGAGDLDGDYGTLEARPHPSVIVPPRAGLSGEDTKVSDLLSASVVPLARQYGRGSSH